MARLMVFTLSIATAAGVLARQQVAPAGNWQSVRNETYSSPLHPVVTRAEFYLTIDVASDGSFRGQWGEYTCVPSIGAYGYNTYPCRASVPRSRSAITSARRNRRSRPTRVEGSRGADPSSPGAA